MWCVMVHMCDGVFLPSRKHNVAICCFCLEALGDRKVRFEHPGEGEAVVLQDLAGGEWRSFLGPENQCPHVCGGADDSCRMLCLTASLCENNLQSCVPLSVQSLFVVKHDTLTVQRRVMHCDHDSF